MFSQSEKEYMKVCWKGFTDCIRWYDLIFWTSAIAIFYLWLGWAGVIIVLVADYLSLGVSAPAIFPGYTLPDIEYNRTCSAGIKDCKICGNEYDHAFNEDYNKSLKWYDKII